MSVGIGLGQRYTAAVAMSQGKKLFVIESDIVESDVDYHHNDGLPVLRGHLDKILKSVSQWIGSRYITLRVAIDDPAVYAHTLNLETLPSRRETKNKLILWQMANAVRLNTDDLQVSYLSRKSDDGKIAVFVTAVEKALFDTINDAFYSIGLNPESIMMSELYRKSVDNASNSSTCVHISLYQEYVSVAFWDANNTPVSIRSFWRRTNPKTSSNEITESIRDIERTIHAFSISNNEAVVEKIFVYTSNDEEQRRFELEFCYMGLSEVINNNAEINLERNNKLQAKHQFYSSAISAALA